MQGRKITIFDTTAGVELPREDLDDAFTRSKMLADSRKHVILNDVFEGVPAR